MICEYLSASGAKVYEDCALRFYARYILKKRSGMDEKVGAGLMAHKCLEYYYNPNNDCTFEEAFQYSMMEEECKNKDAFEHSKTMSLNTIQMYPKEELSVIGTEINFHFYLASGAAARGFIDRIDLVNDTTIELVDYKSGEFVPSLEELEEDHQTNLYALWVYLNPDFKDIELVRFKYLYIRHGEEKVITITREQAMLYSQYFDHLYHAICRNENPLPTLNSFCWNCEHRGECSEYLNIMNVLKIFCDSEEDESAFVNHNSLYEGGFDNAIHIYDKISKLCTALDREKKIVSSWLVEVMKANNLKSAVAKNKKIGLQTRKTSKCQPKTARSLIKKYDVVDKALGLVSASNLSKIFQGNKQALKELQDLSKETESKPFPMVRNIKNKD